MYCDNFYITTSVLWPLKHWDHLCIAIRYMHCDPCNCVMITVHCPHNNHLDSSHAGCINHKASHMMGTVLKCVVLGLLHCIISWLFILEHFRELHLNENLTINIQSCLWILSPQCHHVTCHKISSIQCRYSNSLDLDLCHVLYQSNQLCKCYSLFTRQNTLISPLSL